MARIHDWDLSGTDWTTITWPGYPDSNLDKIFSPDFIYHQVNDGGDNGSYYSDNVELLCNIGCATWMSVPYSDDDDAQTEWPWAGEAGWREAPAYRGQFPEYSRYGIWYSLAVNTDEEIAVLKTLLAHDVPFTIAVDADKYVDLADDLWTISNYVDPSTNHANTVIGYSDN